MILGWLILHKQYSKKQIGALVCVTVGIVIASLVGKLEDTNAPRSLGDQFIGPAMLLVALTMISGLGVMQEKCYERFGRHSEENMFFSHFYSLPVFIFEWADIARHVALFNDSQVVTTANGTGMPYLWLVLAANVTSQYVCIRYVYMLTELTSSLTTALVTTIRKFMSLVFSIIYFRNPFTAWHWLGSTLVLTGSLYYVYLTSTPSRAATDRKKTQ